MGSLEGFGNLRPKTPRRSFDPLFPKRLLRCVAESIWLETDGVPKTIGSPL